ncbi:hypothetical protein KEJ14_04355 [Candidatus Bathyarchaeota archaeon]|nr:hypothetical protein [Candidatus Bathyarchaeota archaeon]
MGAERYKRFLEVESRRAPLERKQSNVGERSLIYWGESRDRATMSKGTSDIISSLYFGEEPQSAVIIDRSVAKILQERLNSLEEENIRLYRRIRFAKFLIGGLLLLVLLMLAMLLF